MGGIDVDRSIGNSDGPGSDDFILNYFNDAEVDFMYHGIIFLPGREG